MDEHYFMTVSLLTSKMSEVGGVLDVEDENARVIIFPRFFVTIRVRKGAM